MDGWMDGWMDVRMYVCMYEPSIMQVSPHRPLSVLFLTTTPLGAMQLVKRPLLKSTWQTSLFISSDTVTCLGQFKTMSTVPSPANTTRGTHNWRIDLVKLVRVFCRRNEQKHTIFDFLHWGYKPS